FKVDIHHDPSEPIDSEEIYQTGLGVMYDITAFPLDHPWLDRTWAPPSRTSGLQLLHTDFGGKDPSHMYNQFAIWGLNHLMLSITLSTGYCQTIAILRWNDIVVGSLAIAKTEALLESPSETSNNRNESTRRIIQPDPRSRVAADGNIEVLIDYGPTAPIEKKFVYLTGIKAMGEAAEKSLQRPVQEMRTKSIGGINWTLIGGSGAFEGTFRAAHSRFAVMKTMAAMIRDQRYQTTYVWIKVDGKNTAAGGLSRGELGAVS
ncbi:MAG: hypothetical protein Q9196_002743, partial [Gyalolechia fulgens]